MQQQIPRSARDDIFVEHPARMSCATEIAATVWTPSYKRATGLSGGHSKILIRPAA
jgi:hypothetical protein